METKTGSQNDLLNDDSDADGDSISVDQIQHSAGSASAVNPPKGRTRRAMWLTAAIIEAFISL